MYVLRTLRSIEMSLSFDEIMQVLSVAGTWFASVGTILAAAVALILARRSYRIMIRAHVGLHSALGGATAEERPVIHLHVTNLSDRRIEISTIGWRIGRRRNRRDCVMGPVLDSGTVLPIGLDYGKSKSVVIDTHTQPDWIMNFVRDFIKDTSRKSLKTLRLIIQTSTGHTEIVVPDLSLIEKLEKVAIQSH